MAHSIKLKKRYPPDGNKHHWVWVLRYWSADGSKEIGEVIGWYAPARDSWKPRSCKGPRLTNKQADEIRTQRRNDLREGRIGQSEKEKEYNENNSDSVPFSQWIDTYVKATRGTIRETTLREYQRALLSLDKCISPKTAADVSFRDVKKFIQSRLREGACRSTVLKDLSSLRRVWYDSHINPNPWAQPKLRRQLKSAPKDWHWYSTDHYRRLMEQCDQWITREESAGRSGRKWLAIKGMIAVAYTSGLRLGEVQNLTWADMDFETGEIEIAPKKATDTTLAWEPKDHERRIVPLIPSAEKILNQLYKTAVQDNPYVFVSAKRHAMFMAAAAAGTWREGKPLINNIRHNFRELCVAANVPLDTFHSLRKSCCTNLLEGGVAPHAVRKIMGHSSLETTIKYYSKVRRDQITVAREVSESYATGQPTGKTRRIKIA